VIRGRLRRRPGDGERARADEEFVDIDPAELTGVFATPPWLRDVITAAVVAAVASPLVSWLGNHHVPRAAGAALVLLAIIAAGLVLVLVLGGITSQTGDLSSHLSDAKNTIEGWLKDLGVDPTKAKEAKQDASSAASSAVKALLDGLGGGITALSSLVFFLSLTALSLLFLLKDGPAIRDWGERHLGVPMPVARTISKRSLQSLRGYFLGVTLVAAFNAVVVLVGALVLGVPLAGTIAAVTFLAGYVPYLGAWTAGAFAVLVALGGAGADAAAGMIVVQLLANGALQQLVQPFAMGAALGIHPLAVLIVTIAGGSLFGAAV
jgi:putative heme transporter